MIGKSSPLKNALQLLATSSFRLGFCTACFSQPLSMLLNFLFYFDRSVWMNSWRCRHPPCLVVELVSSGWSGCASAQAHPLPVNRDTSQCLLSATPQLHYMGVLTHPFLPFVDSSGWVRSVVSHLHCCGNCCSHSPAVWSCFRVRYFVQLWLCVWRERSEPDPFCSQLSVTDAITNPRVFSRPVCLKAIVPTHTYIQSYYSVDKGNVWIILHMLFLLLCFLFFLFG